MKKISKEKFNSFMFFTKSQNPIGNTVEKEWYMNENETLWATIALDVWDNTYTIIYCTRDEKNQIRYLCDEIDIETIEEAREQLQLNYKKIEENILEQTYEKKYLDLFEPIKTNKKQKTKEFSSFFMDICNGKQYSAARNIINETMPHYFDVDGNFKEQFQTSGFDARIWELYLYIYFREAEISVDKNVYAPDFLLNKNNVSVSLEATTVSFKFKEEGIAIERYDDVIAERIKMMPSNWASSLFSKLSHVDKSGKHYWEYEHTEEKPFVIAIADYSGGASMSWSFESLLSYLYGVELKTTKDKNNKDINIWAKIEEHPRDNGRKNIPSNFFGLPNTENISAIVTSPTATVSKFNRIGKQCGFDEHNVTMIKCVELLSTDSEDVECLRYVHKVSEGDSEMWAEGLCVIHNPNAKYPLDIGYFTNATEYFWEDNEVVFSPSKLCVKSSITVYPEYMFRIKK